MHTRSLLLSNYSESVESALLDTRHEWGIHVTTVSVYNGIDNPTREYINVCGCVYINARDREWVGAMVCDGRYCISHGGGLRIYLGFSPRSSNRLSLRLRMLIVDLSHRANGNCAFLQTHTYIFICIYLRDFTFFRSLQKYAPSFHL